MKLINYIVLILIVTQICSCYAQRNVSPICIDEIDFNNQEFVAIWAQECPNFGAESGHQIMINSLFIKCLYKLEKKYNPDFDKDEDCYFLFDKLNEIYLYDIRFNGAKAVRLLKFSNELSEILELYKKWNDQLLEKDRKNSSDSPLTGSRYCWRKR